ncbi:MAG: transposon-encoded TnpW family protein [Acutalibacteraceae bacterium]|uniref:transposon-encoded TnpW family protein n=1 Tax=Ruminococcus sp. TaxID=41978 RepID=UPI002E772D8F|nr:transposon-encoded TnpW family protein [Ruminococcus sp.]MEE1057425.1 transposon-encoded TnpW family protein [Acutalibacteraceae bacterium]MEE1263734.1 transposon-encoded TnpW family protein [Ruminococcus sp.]
MTNNYTTMIRRIGKTTYHVKVFCKENGETMEDKILRIVRNEGFKSDEPCGIITMPQMSRSA